MAEDMEAIARSIVDENRFMALGTADGAGTPWVSPVWYAPASYRDYIWVSRQDTRHSRNIARRPEVAVVIYDSQRPGGWAAVYMTGTAAEVHDVDDTLADFNRTSAAHGLRPWSRAEVSAESEFRLYRMVVSEQYVLDSHDRRHPVDL
ncbi:pyridoxamine 5'-phosphate oxidase family protein [Nocardioides sp. NPDC058538]|uniref:pyridoxamine 5'-phosphate oxidase family protein n=1 Tax=Nocardioides sp. NPDC058538 TaxID=3346542 RepID=UPI003665F363